MSTEQFTISQHVNLTFQLK